MIQIIYNTLSASAASFSISRGGPELQVQSPSALVCTPLLGRLYLGRLDLYPRKLFLAAMKHPRGHPLLFPAHGILNLLWFAIPVCSGRPQD